MNREQIVKALECCTFSPKCEECPIGGNDCIELDQNALSFIRELTEENRLLQSRVLLENHLRTRADEMLAHVASVVKADTVRKMQEMVKERCTKGGIYPAFVARVIEQVAEETLAKEHDRQSLSQSTDVCVSCGAVIPEGRQVCPSCLEKTNKKTKKARKESEKRTEN